MTQDASYGEIRRGFGFGGAYVREAQQGKDQWRFLWHGAYDLNHNSRRLLKYL